MPTVIVYWSPGRTPEQKQRVTQRIFETLVEDGGARPEDVLVIFQNIEAGDSARPGQTTPQPTVKRREDRDGR